MSRYLAVAVAGGAQRHDDAVAGGSNGATTHLATGQGNNLRAPACRTEPPTRMSSLGSSVSMTLTYTPPVRPSNVRDYGPVSPLITWKMINGAFCDVFDQKLTTG